MLNTWKSSFIARFRRCQRREAAQAYRPPAWMETTVEELEAALAGQFRAEGLAELGIQTGSGNEDDEEEVLEELYCAACNKGFRSQKQYGGWQTTMRRGANAYACC